LAFDALQTLPVGVIRLFGSDSNGHLMVGGTGLEPVTSAL
jgi:hypothetical protein